MSLSDEGRAELALRQREDRFKFRGWDPVIKEILYYHHLNDKFTDDEFFYEMKWMQCTGLKDKNGMQHPKCKTKFIVRWREDWAGFRAEYLDGSWATFANQIDEKGQATRIGNIHENPELLK